MNNFCNTRSFYVWRKLTAYFIFLYLGQQAGLNLGPIHISDHMRRVSINCQCLFLLSFMSVAGFAIHQRVA